MLNKILIITMTGGILGFTALACFHGSIMLGRDWIAVVDVAILFLSGVIAGLLLNSLITEVVQ